ncbi:MAG: DUF5663 domain-containing protein [Patescibacteria group bacterium]
MITKEELRKIILKDLEIGHLSFDAQDRILEKFSENITKRITLAVLENLPESARSEFDIISASGNQEKLQEFLKLQIPNIEELLQKTIKFTVNEFKEMAGINKS